MKQKLLNLLAIFVAFLTAIPIANADVAINEPTCIWNKTFSTPGVNSYQPIILSNGKLVVTDVATNLSGMNIKKQYIIDQDGVVEKSAAYEVVSTGLAIDDAGNAVYAHYDTQVTANNTFMIISMQILKLEQRKLLSQADHFHLIHFIMKQPGI